MPDQMHAAVQTRFGGPDTLHYTRVVRPTPRNTDLLIRVHTVPVHYGDLLARRFNEVTANEFNMPGVFLPLARLAFGRHTPKKPILGSEFSGTVAAVGQGVSRFNVGDPVFGFLGQTFGASAEYLRISETDLVAHKPPNVSFETAAMLPYGAMTALCLLRKLNLQSGQHLLINGASGSIGSAAVQLAKHAGATVTGVCGTPRMDYVKRLGADHVIDYTTTSPTSTGQRYDAILDVLGKLDFAHIKGSLAPAGTLLCASFKTRQLVQMLTTRLIGKQRVICGMANYTAQDIDAVRQLMADGVLTAIIDRSFPLAQTDEAHRYAESGQHTGHIAIACQTTD